jgi:hypothetical protein
MGKTSNFILVLLLSNTCTAEIYKWVDPQGNTIYSEEPPETKQKNYDRIDGSLNNLSSTEAPKKDAYPIRQRSNNNQKQRQRQRQTNLKQSQDKKARLEIICDRLEKKVKRAEQTLRARGLGNKWARLNKRKAQAELTDECWRKR